jgi:hypothetical protein
MSNKENKQSADNVRSYLKGIGHEISASQSYEVVARAQGLKNKHVLAGSTGATSTRKGSATAHSAPGLKVFEIDERPFSVREMAERGYDVDVVVPVNMEIIQNDGIEELNDLVSELITGSICGLQDIGFKVYPHFYGPDHVAMRVTAQRGEQLSASEEGEAFFWQLEDKKRLAQILKKCQQLEVTQHLCAPEAMVVDFADPKLVNVLAASSDYVNDEGEYTDAWSALRHQPALQLSALESAEKQTITFEELVFADYSEGTWNVDICTDEGRLTYRIMAI